MKKRIGPEDHGRKMSLRSYEFVATKEGYRYELARGYIVVSMIPGYHHMRQASKVRTWVDHYHVENPARLFAVLTAGDCKILVPEWESERHPDITIYLNPPLNRTRTMWRTWLPDIVVEVVSLRSRDTDYTQKRDEYWSLGIKEYWIVDADRQQILVLRRGKSDWIEKPLGPGDAYETKLLPGFKLACDPIFALAGEPDE